MKKTNNFRKNIISNLIKKSILTVFEKSTNLVKNKKINKKIKNNELNLLAVLTANKTQDVVISSPLKLDNSLDQSLSQKFDELFVLNHNKINLQNFNLLINDMIKDIFKNNPMEKQIFTLKYVKNYTDQQVINDLKIDLSILNDSKVKLQNWFNYLVNSVQLKTILLKLLKVKNIITIDFVKFKVDFSILADIYKSLDQLNDFKCIFLMLKKPINYFLLIMKNQFTFYFLLIKY